LEILKEEGGGVVVEVDDWGESDGTVEAESDEPG
jgi:hypothetical protein